MTNETCVCTLSAESVTSEDNGQWRCEVVNKHGKSSATCSVKVIGKYEERKYLITVSWYLLFLTYIFELFLMHD